MKLRHYLDNNYYTTETLLTLSRTSPETLLDLQAQQVMPVCSYELDHNVTCHSFFGDYQVKEKIEYYAKGMVEWLGLIKNSSPKNAFSIFSERYQKKLKQLNKQGFNCKDSKLNSNVIEHINAEWQHFLNGTYGLCTKSGLPEDIAGKELAIIEINRLINIDKLSENQQTQLNSLVNILDKSSALFAPHERSRSSRRRLIDDVRVKYQLIN